MEKISTCLWFDNQAEEAVKFYTSIFKNSNIGSMSRYDEVTAKAAGMQPGTILTVMFELDGREFMALNGGPAFKFTEAISLIVNCKDQQEVDYYWDKLTGDGGQESMCGWLKDKYGLSWQIVPDDLGKLLGSGDKEKTSRVMKEVLTMKKLDVSRMRQAYEG